LESLVSSLNYIHALHLSGYGQSVNAISLHQANHRSKDVSISRRFIEIRKNALLVSLQNHGIIFVRIWIYRTNVIREHERKDTLRLFDQVGVLDPQFHISYIVLIHGFTAEPARRFFKYR
jgi:hypothetical protein